jgi:dihydropteroate synthase
MQSSMDVGGIRLDWGTRTYVMGILNITSDSFSGDGLYPGLDDVEAGDGQDFTRSSVEQARRFINAEAKILDIGGESTRPGAQPVSADEEMTRVIPIIEAISSDYDILISIDTHKANVAEAALNAGAHIVNDVWGLKADPDLASVIVQHNAPVILMHNRSSWVHAEVKERLGGRYVGVPYENLVEDVQRELLESVNIAHKAGIRDDKIILDPGIGFGKTVEQNLELMDRLDQIRGLGYPVMIGPSRKSFIGYTLDLPPDQRIEGTAASVAVGITRGADIVRVHDVEFMVHVVRMVDAIVRRGY